MTIQLAPHQEQVGFNLRRWAELLEDPLLQGWEGRIETDRHGHIIMSPPPAARHARLQSRIHLKLSQLMEKGEALTECPISTSDGIKAADLAWASEERIVALGEQTCFSVAPEICVEVLSPGNSRAEIEEKTALYFDAGAEEVWLCSTEGVMTFLTGEGVSADSAICGGFPALINL